MPGGDTLKIYFDGGCRPNPGPIEVATVARGVVRIDDALGQGGNGEAEWLALIAAARLAAAMAAPATVLLGDSANIVAIARGLAPPRSATARAHLATFQAIARTLPGLKVRRIGRAQNLAGIALAARHPR